MVQFIKESSVPVLTVQNLSWKDNVRLIFKTPVNLLLCLEGVQCGFDWESEQWSPKNKTILIDPSHAYGVTFCGIYRAIRDKGAEKAEETAHRSASKKVGRLVQAGDVIDVTKAIQAASVVNRVIGVAKDVGKNMRDAIDSNSIVQMYESEKRLYQDLAEVLSYEKTVLNDNSRKQKVAKKLLTFDPDFSMKYYEIAANPILHKEMQ